MKMPTEITFKSKTYLLLFEYIVSRLTGGKNLKVSNYET